MNKQKVEVIKDLRYNTFEVFDLKENFIGCFYNIKEIKKKYEIV